MTLDWMVLLLALRFHSVKTKALLLKYRTEGNCSSLETVRNRRLHLCFRNPPCEALFGFERAGCPHHTSFGPDPEEEAHRKVKDVGL